MKWRSKSSRERGSISTDVKYLLAMWFIILVWLSLFLLSLGAFR